VNASINAINVARG